MRILVVWEPVLPTDWTSPSSSALKRVADPRAIQFWDKARLISHSMGEHDRKSIVWDHISVYPAGVIWKEQPEGALYSGGPVVRVKQPAREALVEALRKM